MSYSARPFRWGIFGTGAVSAKFVAGLAADPGSVPALVASRSIDTARAFSAGAGVAVAVEGYETATTMGGVDAMYIATPPSEHAHHAIMCIEAGIPVLVEKPFATSATEARRVVDAAREHGVFVMEAMWTRFLPAARAMHDLVVRGEVGDIRLVTGSFGTSRTVTSDQGMFDPTLGGGAMSHLGVYPLSLAQWLFGTPTLVQALGTVGTTGVDEDVAFQLRHEGGAIASFVVSLRSWTPDDFQVLGTDGVVGFRGSIVRPSGLNVWREPPRGPDSSSFAWKQRLRQHGAVHRIAQTVGRSSRARGRSVAHRYAGNGYHYEAEEVRRCVQGGLTESRIMPLDESVAIAVTIDQIRDLVLTRASEGTEFS